LKTIALATCASLPHLDPSDQGLIPAFAEKNILAKPVVWDDQTVDWFAFDAIIIRNTWDYYLKGESFIKWVEKLNIDQVLVLNDCEILLDNVHKFYLRSFENKGIPIIPTLFIDKNAKVGFESIPWDKFVVKPAISAGSYLTQIHEKSKFTQNSFVVFPESKDWLIQPFLPEIQINGELSLIFINRTFSHAVQKKPVDGDFRVQKQYGGIYESFSPSQSLMTVAQKIINSVEGNLLFARVDGIMLNETFHLMELEMIEPDLYMHFEPKSYANFVEASIKLMANGNHNKICTS
jgi:glutathione synthase/RimK-type ligase-like ATP-grasp enzyme